MQVSVESISNLERRLTVEVPQDQVDEAVQKQLKDLARTVKLKGFRPGKVPLKVVASRYGSQVRREVVSDLMQRTFYEAVSQERLRPAGTPRFEPGETEAGLRYTATFEIYPEIEPADLSGRQLELPVAEITEADVDETIETIRRQNATWEAVERPAAEGDRVVVDYKGTIDGEPFTGGEGADVAIELGRGRMLPDFEQGLVGAAPGETRTVEVTFPDDYRAREVAGKIARFTVTVKRVEAARLPEVDADFARRLGVADGDVERMRQEVRQSMQRELDEALEAQAKEAVMDLLLEAHRFEVPAALVEEESANLARQMAQNLQRQGVRENLDALQPALFRDQAERRVRLGLVLAEIVKRQGLAADPARVRAAVERIAAAYEQPEQVVQWYYGERGRLAEIESMELERQVVDWVKEQVQVTEIKRTFREVMNARR